MKNKASIGSSSLILIFIVLCLATFGLLSLSSAKGDLALADRNAAAVREYYEADQKGEEFLRMVDQTVLRVSEEAGSQEPGEILREELGTYYDIDSGRIITEIPMDRDQALHVELEAGFGAESATRVLVWKVLNLEDYEIDNSMPVWTGDTSE